MVKGQVWPHMLPTGPVLLLGLEAKSPLLLHPAYGSGRNPWLPDLVSSLTAKTMVLTGWIYTQSI